MHHRAAASIANRLRIAPENAGSVGAGFWLPALTTLRKLLLGEFCIDCPSHSIDGDDVAIAKQRNRAADGGLGSDVSDAKASRTAGEATVRDQRDFFAHTLAIERTRGLQHFAHSRPTTRAFVADDEDVTLLVPPGQHGVQAIFLTIEHLGGPSKRQSLQPRNLRDGSLRRQIAPQARYA